MILGTVNRLWSMGLQASILILVVLAVRHLLKKYPKIYAYSLWVLVGVRLLCPVFVETPFSLQPKSMRPDKIVWENGYFTEGKTYFDGQSAQNQGTQNVLSEKENENKDIDKSHQEPSGDSGSVKVSDSERMGSGESGADGKTSRPAGIFGLLVVVYLAGVGVFALLYVVQYVRMRYRISTAVRGRENVWFSEKIDSPFVLGIIKPRIMMPYGLKKREGYHILKHEQTHIRHHDPLIRLAGTICICLHWWNPLVWFSVSKMNQDMEMFCDESVLRGASPEEKKSYARTLLSFAVRRSGLSVGLAFGESHTERRVHNLMGKRKGGILIAGLVAIMAVFCTAAFMTVPGIEAEGADARTDRPEADNAGENGLKTDFGGSNINNGYGSDKQMTSGTAKGDFLLSEGDVEYLTALCPRIPEFASEQDMDVTFWREFLFCYYTSDFDRETVDRYVEQLGFEIPYVKVNHDEVQRTVEEIFGKPLAEYVENPGLLSQDSNILFEEDSFYISASDSPDYKYEYVYDTNTDIMKEVELLEGLYDEEEYHSRVHLYLLPAENERGFIVDGKEKFPVLQDTEEGVINGQSFEVEMNPYGKVTFAAYAPDTPMNPSDDVAFKLIRDGQVIRTFGGYDTQRQDKSIWEFQNVAAVSFPDLNGDGFTDVVTIVNYKFGDSTLSEARIYTGRENEYFLEEEYLEEMYNNAHDNKTVSEISRFVALPENQDFFVRESIYGRWKVTGHIPPTGIYALSEGEIADLEGLQLQYGMYWYKMGNEEPYTLIDYNKEYVSAEKFEEDFKVDMEAMGLSAESFHYFELEGVQDFASSFGQFFYQIDADNALIYYEGVFFKAVRE